MTPLAVLIAFTLIAEFAVEMAADLLNLRALAPKPPLGFEDVYDGDKYARSQEYTRVRTRFGILTGAFGLAVLLVFWFAGGFRRLDLWVDHWSPLATGLLYIGALFFAKEVLNLPFQLYSTFVIEERFGFNRTSAGTFALDKSKVWLLAVVLGGPILALVLVIFQKWGPGAWIYGWGAVTVFSLFLQFIAPTWIMPLFNKFTPLADGPLRQSVFDYARKVDYPLTNLFVMDGSKRSSKSNAFFTGFGKNKRIALFDTLIEKHTVPEMVAVLAHEIGHYKMKHVLKGALLGIFQTGVMFYVLSWSLRWPALFEAFGVQGPSVHVGLVVFSIFYGPVSLLLSIPLTAFSRKNEFEADRYAVQTTGESGSMAAALRKLSAHNLANLTPHPFYVFLHYTHPPMIERIRALNP